MRVPIVASAPVPSRIPACVPVGGSWRFLSNSTVSATDQRPAYSEKVDPTTRPRNRGASRRRTRWPNRSSTHPPSISMSCPDRYPRGVGSPPKEGRPGSHQIPDRLPIDASGDGRPHPSQRAEWGLPTNLGQQPEQARGRGLRLLRVGRPGLPHPHQPRSAHALEPLAAHVIAVPALPTQTPPSSTRDTLRRRRADASTPVERRSAVARPRSDPGSLLLRPHAVERANLSSRHTATDPGCSPTSASPHGDSPRSGYLLHAGPSARGRRRPSTGFTGPAAPARSARRPTTPDRD